MLDKLNRNWYRKWRLVGGRSCYVFWPDKITDLHNEGKHHFTEVQKSKSHSRTYRSYYSATAFVFNHVAVVKAQTGDQHAIMAKSVTSKNNPLVQ